MPYLQNGTVIKIVAKLENGTYLVQRGFEGDDSEPWLGEPEIAQKIYDEPPVEFVDKKIVDAERRLESVSDQVTALRSEVRELVKAKSDIEEMCATNAAIRRVHDFLVKGITHLVQIDYGDVKLIDPKKTQCGDSERTYGRHLKLVSLFGRTDGDLQWNIHKYSDGSGSQMTECVPFTSEAEAVEFAKKRIAELLIDPDNHWVESTIKSAKALDVAVPTEIHQKVRSSIEEKLRNNLDGARNSAKIAEQKLVDFMEGN